MPALKHIALLALCLTAACDGPKLFVGDLQESTPDAGEPDDAATDRDGSTLDASLPDARVRDAGGDGRVDIIIVQRCSESSDCHDPRYPKCNTAFNNFYVCTGCQTDRDCKQSEYCDTSPYVWQCRDHKDDSPPVNGVP